LPTALHRPIAVAGIAAALTISLLALAACDPQPPGGPDHGDPVPPDAGPVLPPCLQASPASATAPLLPCLPPPCPPEFQASATTPLVPCLPTPSVRVDLTPVYQLTPAPQLPQFEIHGQAMTAADFQAQNVGVSVQEKLDEIGTQIGLEYGVGALELFPDAEQRTRAASIPFRGNPSDVALLTVDGARKAYVPLGGDVMTPGNEVAVVDLASGAVARIRVGIRPQQILAHPESGLVFVCHQYANYISIIDGRSDTLLENAGVPVEIATDFYCADLAIAERNPSFGEDDELYLYVANEYRASVLKYAIDIVRDINDDVANVAVLPPRAEYPRVPELEIVGVGRNPHRLHLDQAKTRLYVANHRGGELAAIDLATNQVLQRVALGAPAIDVIEVGARLLVPTTTPHRGLLLAGAPADSAVLAGPIALTGVDSQSHEVHPGARFDGTASYDVEDLRSGIFELATADLAGAVEYITDDNDADDAFTAEQKQLEGALPWSIARNADGTRVYVPLHGSDLVQELDVIDAAVGLRASGRAFATRELPAAVAVDQAANQLVVASAGGDVLEIFDLASGVRLSEIDLGYAEPRYPATTIEAGEYLFATARWSNDGRKSCAGCHTQELSSDGLGFAVGTAAPTTLRPVKHMHDLIATGPYLWNGGAPGGSLGAMAIAAQTRTNCELVLYGLVEGAHTAPAARAGDAANVTRDVTGDAQCRPAPDLDPATGLPANFGDIQAVIEAQQQTAAAAMATAVRAQLTSAGLFHGDPALDRQEIERAIGFYTVAELRLPPNTLAQQRKLAILDFDTENKLAQGENLFRNAAGCAACHDPDAPDHPFTDSRVYGRGVDWLGAFVTTYESDPRLLDLLPDGLPAPVLAAAGIQGGTREPAIFQPVLDGLIPACFSAQQCLRLDDPLAVRGSDAAEEARRLRRLIVLFLAGAGFFPGSIVDQPMVNTPSLRGAWQQRSLLHHGLARTIEEAILPPGHAALRSNEHGHAVDAQGNFDVHGSVRDLSAAQIEALGLYVRSIE
jgi:DNA-binding beta-propeller fold protein YncE/cytochrome c553